MTYTNELSGPGGTTRRLTRVSVGKKPFFGMYVSRIPPSTHAPTRTSARVRQLDIPARPHPNPERNLVHLLAVLPIPVDGVPEMLPVGSEGKLVGPWRTHPTLPLHLPESTLVDVRARRAWPGLGMHMSPSVIGLTFRPDTCTSVALRILGAVRERERLIDWLVNLALLAESREGDRAFEVNFIDAMNLPTEMGLKLRAELYDQRVLLQASCIWWLLAEALYAPPAPFGTPALDPASRQLQSWIAPSLDFGQDPTDSELCRAVFLAQEGFLIGGAELSPRPGWILDTMTALAFRRSSTGETFDGLIRAYKVWSLEDGQRCAKRMSAYPSSLRAAFVEITGTRPETVMIHGALLIAILIARLRGHQAVADTYAELGSTGGHSEDQRTVVGVFENLLSSTATEMQRKLRDEHPSADRRWGALPRTPSTTMLNRPLLRTRKGLLPWSVNVLAAAIRNIPRDVFVHAGYNRRTVGGDLGWMFEAYVEQRLASLDMQRHRWVNDDDMDGIVNGPRPDFVIAHGREAVVVEATAGRLDLGAVTGQEGAHAGVLKAYREKLGQAQVIVRDLAMAGQLVGLNRLEAAFPLLVVDDPLVFTPRVAGLAAGDESPYVCGIDEFDRLIDLGSVGWSIPSLIRRWQSEDSNMLLAHSLHHAASVRRDPGLSMERFAYAMASHFDGPPAN